MVLIADDMPSAGSALASPAGVMLPRNERIGPPRGTDATRRETGCRPRAEAVVATAMMTGAAHFVAVLVAGGGITIWVRSATCWWPAGPSNPEQAIVLVSRWRGPMTPCQTAAQLKNRPP